MIEPRFRLNGITVPLTQTDPAQSLLRWLKSQRLTGTKEGCGDGDCGACTVAVLEPQADGPPKFVAVNSCLLPMGALPGRSVLTVEGLADGDTLHPAQRVMAEAGGSQCGYCTPGIVMSLFVGQQDGDLSDACIDGNLCRCTGYRPIRDAARKLATEAIPVAPDIGCDAWSSATLGSFHSPLTITDALALKRTHPDAAWICGATDLGVPLSRGQTVASVFIALDRIPALHTITRTQDAVRIGAAVPLSRIERELAGVFPLLDDMLHGFAARQVKNRASFGGSLGSASPIGDLAPVLLALDGVVHLVGPDGERDVAIEHFFLDYRKTVRQRDELIAAVTLPLPHDRITASYKIAKRQTDDISIVAASFALARDRDGRVRHVRLAFGGVAAIPKRATAVESLLIGERLDDATVARARAALTEAFTPLSDHRAGADYRRALVGNLFVRFVQERCA